VVVFAKNCFRASEKKRKITYDDLGGCDGFNDAAAIKRGRVSAFLGTFLFFLLPSFLSILHLLQIICQK